MAKNPQVSVQIAAVDQFSVTMAKFRADLARTRQPVGALASSFSVLKVPPLGAATAALAAYQTRVQQTVGSLTSIVPALGAVGGIASSVGFARMASDWAAFNVRLANNAVRTGTTIQGLNSLQGAARLSGLSADVATQALGGLNDALAGATFGRAPQAVAAFRQLGIAFHDASGRARSAADALPEVANAVQRLVHGAHGDVRPAVNFLQSIGITAEALPLLGLGAQRLAELRREWEEVSGVTDASAEASRRFTAAYARLEGAMDDTARTIVTALEPALTPLLRELGTWTAAHSGEIADGFRNVGNGIGSIASAAPDAFRRLREFGTEMNSIFNTIRDIGQVVGADQIAPWLRGMNEEWRRRQVPMERAPAGPSQYDDEVFRRLDPLRQGLYRENSEARERFNRQFAPGRYPAGGGAGPAPPRQPSSDAPAEQRFPGLERLPDNTFRWRGTGAATVPTPPGQIGPNARYIHDQFRGAGYTEEQTAGMLGHIRGESWDGRANDYSPGAYNPAGGNYGAQGIGQWRGPRVEAFRSRYGHEPRFGTIEEQTAFMLQELRTSERTSGAALSASTTAAGAAEAMVRLYGRPLPQDLPALAQQRMGWAQGWQSAFGTPNAKVDPVPNWMGGRRRDGVLPGGQTNIPFDAGTTWAGGQRRTDGVLPGGQINVQPDRDTSWGGGQRPDGVVPPGTLNIPFDRNSGWSGGQTSGGSTVRIDVNHGNVPDGVTMKTSTEGEGVEMGNIRVRRAMADPR